MGSNLRKHLKMHCGEKVNKCHQCDFKSAWESHLRRHLKMHSGEKSSKCNQCDFASSQASDLRRHVKTHSGTYNWPNLEPMQVVFFLAGEITQVKESIPWVCSASGNVFVSVPFFFGPKNSDFGRKSVFFIWDRVFCQRGVRNPRHWLRFGTFGSRL